MSAWNSTCRIVAEGVYPEYVRLGMGMIRSVELDADWMWRIQFDKYGARRARDSYSSGEVF